MPWIYTHSEKLENIIIDIAIIDRAIDKINVDIEKEK